MATKLYFTCCKYVLRVRTLTCGSLRNDVTPPPPKAFSKTKLNALIPGSSYLQKENASLLNFAVFKDGIRQIMQSPHRFQTDPYQT